VEMRDLGVNFFLSEVDIGKTRSSVVASKLKELNPLCNVNISTILDENVITKHTALVITQVLTVTELIKYNEFCRQQQHNISFFYAFASGVSLDLFVDHGSKHIVHDFNGERPIQKLITDIYPISESETVIRYETPEGQQPVSLNNGYFEITEVSGIDSINNGIYAVSRDDKDPVKTLRIPYSFPSSYKYISGKITRLLCMMMMYALAQILMTIINITYIIFHRCSKEGYIHVDLLYIYIY